MLTLIDTSQSAACSCSRKCQPAPPENNLVVVCAWCNSLRDSSGRWVKVDNMPRLVSENSVTHTICGSCKSEFTRQLGGMLAPQPALG
ncbi:MAG: hypothetical protein FOGNACKC_03736 [Anaerolineae bacterium]|nr:hypothetical protein [Anaerolineae bacterium]